MRLYLFCCLSFATLCVWAKPDATFARRARGDAGTGLHIESSVVRHGLVARSNAPRREAASVATRESALDLELVDESGARMDGRVAVFPAERHWKEAELVQLYRRAHAARLTLAPGLYRVLVLTAPGARPELVEVADAPVQLRVSARARRSFHWWLRIEDEGGRPIRRALLHQVRESESCFVPVRYLPDSDSYCGDPSWPSHGHGDAILAESDGRFDLGRVREAGCGWELRLDFDLVIEGHGSVAVSGSNREAGDRLYRACAVSEETVRLSLRLPDGSIPARPRIRIHASARRAGERPERIEVHVSLRGYHPLSCSIHPHEARALPLRTLQPRVRSPAK